MIIHNRRENLKSKEGIIRENLKSKEGIIRENLKSKEGIIRENLVSLNHPHFVVENNP